jgi:hypothetical protein
MGNYRPRGADRGTFRLGAHPIGNWRTHPEFADAQLTGIN